MKVKNTGLKNSKLIFRDKFIEFDAEGISEDLTKEEATSLASLDLFEIVQENSKKDIKKEENIVPEDKEDVIPEKTKKDDKKSDKTKKDSKDKK